MLLLLSLRVGVQVCASRSLNPDSITVLLEQRSATGSMLMSTVSAVQIPVFPEFWAPPCHTPSQAISVTQFPNLLSLT